MTTTGSQPTGPGIVPGPDQQVENTPGLLTLGSYLRRGQASADARRLFLTGGRQADTFYRHRWSHDKMVHSTHGVNCTGSCAWEVYVSDGIITWEKQITDYPTTGPDMPEYEPRGCPRGAAFSWYTYSPTRIRYPYVRSVLLDAFRAAKADNDGDPVAAWAQVTGDPATAKAYKSARGKGGMVRVGWDEAMEIVAAAYVHTIRTWGPDRIAGFSVIPAMSQVSYGAGGRLHELIGGTMLSFYDWYADLPPASPQVFGDQTDVPEAGDWYNSQYLMMWGSNLPLTRTPDAHFMTEARYHGQKVVAVSPDYADNTKFADQWLRVAPGTDGALAQAMGHVILSEFHVKRQEPFFLDYMRRHTDAPFLTDLKPADVPAFDKVKDQLKEQLLAEQAQKLAAEHGEAFRNDVYEQPDSLQPVADKLKLNIQTATNVTRTVQPDAIVKPLANAKFLSALFAPDSLERKNNTEAIEFAPGQLVAGRVVKHTPAHPRPFDEVKTAVRERLIAERAAEAARKEGTEKLAAWKAKPEEAKGLPAAITLSREETHDLPAAVVEGVLRADTSALPAFIGVDLGEQGYTLARIEKIVPRSETKTEVAQQMRQQYDIAWGAAEALAYYELLKQRFKARILVEEPKTAASEEAGR